MATKTERMFTATVRSMVTVVDAGAPEPFSPQIDDVPVCVRMPDVGVLGGALHLIEQPELPLEQ